MKTKLVIIIFSLLISLSAFAETKTCDDCPTDKPCQIEYLVGDCMKLISWTACQVSPEVVRTGGDDSMPVYGFEPKEEWYQAKYPGVVYSDECAGNSLVIILKSNPFEEGK